MDVLDDRKVKTRKPHVCHGCQQLIPANTEEVWYQSVADEGTIYTNHTCKRCSDWLARNRNYFDDVYYEGDIREAMMDMGEWDLPKAIESTEQPRPKEEG